MKKWIFGFAALLLLGMASAGVCADISVALDLDRPEATLADTVQLAVKVTGARSSDSKPVLHGLDDFVVTRAGTSSRVEIVNGRMTAGIEYTYFIQAKKTGTFQIGPAEIRLEGRVMKSNPVTLVVKEAAQRPDHDGALLFLEAEISSQDVYVEEQSIYTLRLYRRSRVKDLSVNLPDQQYTVFKQLGEPVEYQRPIKGIPYQVLEVRYAILCSKAGDYLIGPAKMNMTVLQANRRSPIDRFFDDSFFKDPFFSLSSGRPETLLTKPFKLSVHALPEQDKPNHFSGLVGDFRITSKLEPVHIKAGESATLTVSVSGTGNVNRMPDLTIPELTHSKVYADQPILKMENSDHGIGGTKTIKWAIVPEKAGQVDLPPLALSFFDPKTATYKTLKTAAHTLRVGPGQNQPPAASKTVAESMAASKGPVKQEVKNVGKDILPVHSSIKDLAGSYKIRYSGWVFWLLFLGPFSLYLMICCLSALKKKSPKLIAQSRSKSASKELINLCREEGTSNNQLMDALKNYMNSRFNLSIGTLTADEAVNLLKMTGAEDATLERMAWLIRKLENAVYTGRGEGASELTEEASGIVKAIEKEIR